MSTSLRWTSGPDADLDLVARTRMRCYAPAASELESYRQGIGSDPRDAGAEFLLAEEEGDTVGTATSLPLTMWARGGSVSCQGVAWVGTVRTHRRRAGGEEPGVATRVMREVVRRGREQGQAVSALMPFRASFYEHFGYGIVERRLAWTVPLSLLPRDVGERMHFAGPDDVPALVACRQRIARRGQCDMERSRASWEATLREADSGFLVVDRDSDGSARGWIWFKPSKEDGRNILRLPDLGYEDVPALRRLLSFLGGQKDQYSAAVLPLPIDLPLNRLLRETQLPHRPVEHPTAESRLYTRMQVRVLDHVRFLEALHLPPEAKGRATVAVRETEGHTARFTIEFEAGRTRVTPAAAEPDFECTDVTWAAVACGDLRASRAAELGLAVCARPEPARLLDVLAEGPAPFCGEYF